jgi:hypothetical protein
MLKFSWNDDPNRERLDYERLMVAVRHGLKDICGLLTKPARERVVAELALGADMAGVLAFEAWLESRITGGTTSDAIVAVLERHGVDSATAAAVVKTAIDQKYRLSRLDAIVKTNYQD